MPFEVKKLKGGGEIQCRVGELYYILTESPRKVGDIAEIEVPIALFGKPRTIVRVMLREAEDGSLWLVKMNMKKRWI